MQFPKRTKVPPVAAKAAPKAGLSPAQLTAQAWLPIKDLHDGCLIRPDGGVVAGIQIAPYSLDLKSTREQEQVIQGFQAAINGLDIPWQLLSVYRPVDLDAYLTTLDTHLAATAGNRRRVLGEYTRWVRQQVQGGEMVERRYYLLMTRTGRDAVADHQQTLRGLIDDLHRIHGFRADRLTDALWRELLFLLFHSGQAAIESIPDGGPWATPLYRTQEG